MCFGRPPRTSRLTRGPLPRLEVTTSKHTSPTPRGPPPSALSKTMPMGPIRSNTHPSRKVGHPLCASSSFRAGLGLLRPVTVAEPSLPQRRAAYGTQKYGRSPALQPPAMQCLLYWPHVIHCKSPVLPEQIRVMPWHFSNV